MSDNLDDDPAGRPMKSGLVSPNVIKCKDCRVLVDLSLDVANICVLCEQFLCENCDGYRLIQLYGYEVHITCKECLEYHTSGSHNIYIPGGHEYGLHLDSFPKFAANIAAPYKAQIKALEAKVDHLQRMLDFQPDGPGAIAAKLNFELLRNSQPLPE